MSGNRRTHGYSGTRTYRSWEQMKYRCLNSNSPAYQHYGGRGITVCAAWLTFENFLEDMGECPPDLTLEREANDGPYSKENCRWATRAEQTANTRATVRLTYNGKTQHIEAWARETGLGKILRQRLERGWSVERSLTEPKKARNKPPLLPGAA